MAQHKFAVSLNDNDAEERQWIEGIANSGMIPAHVLKEALRVYFGTTRDVESIVTTGDVVEAINAGFAMLGKKLDNITMASPTQPAPSVDAQSFVTVNSITGEEMVQAVERVPIDVQGEFASMVRKAARPGMRLPD